MENKFLIVVPVHNSVEWIERCLDSILSQSFQNFESVVVDDCSTDGTWDKICHYPFTIVRNSKRIGSGLANIKKGIDIADTQNNTIIATVDGDDYLADKEVLAYLNNIYDDNTWLTYGQYEPLSHGYHNYCKPLSEAVSYGNGLEIIKNLNSRTYRKGNAWATSHLRTFRKFLWDQIKQEDLKDSDGNYFNIGWDLAFMYPMIEMAGDKRIKFIDKVLYIYNDLNPNNDFKTDPAKSLAVADYIQSKELYDER